jgi:uncharacterized protein (DUF2141 family)
MIGAFLLFLSLSLSGMQENDGELHRLRLNLEGLETSGTIRVLVFDQADGFPSDSIKAVRSAVFVASESQMSFELEQLPEGTYAISIHCDSNSDMRLDRNKFGIPTEGIGVSNNSYRKFGPPRFSDAQILLQDDSEIDIQIKYY